MAGSLIKIDEEIVTSAVASVSLLGIDSTYDVYVVRYNNWNAVNDNVTGRIRFTASGTANTTANYDFASKNLDATGTFGNNAITNFTYFDVINSGTATGEVGNAILYLFNLNNASEYSFMTVEITTRNASGTLKGHQGGGVLTVTEANDGVEFFFGSGNIASGTFTLYGLKK
jgi:hypothetical protein